MADFVKIQLIEGANEDGTGGTVIDAPSAKMPDGHIQLILDAFEFVHGLDDETKTRNYAKRIREYSAEVVRAATVKRAKADAEATANSQADEAIGAVEVIE